LKLTGLAQGNSANSSSNLNDQYGKYGIIKESDFSAKYNEFIAWAIEVKKVDRDSMSTKDERMLFLEYMEDYNTATFPDPKYYSLEAAARNQASHQAGSTTWSTMSGMTDEELLREQRRQQALISARERESSTVAALRDQLRQARETNDEMYQDVLHRHEKRILEKPTFESIAKERKEHKKELEHKRKFR